MVDITERYEKGRGLTDTVLFGLRVVGGDSAIHGGGMRFMVICLQKWSQKFLSL